MKRSAVILILAVILTQMLWAGMAEGAWTCEFCEKTNYRRFCTSCGRSMEEATNKEAAACFHGNHDYRPATCTEPQTCNRCGATQGDALGHDWLPATREQPETCSRCGMTRGEKLHYDVGDIYIFGHYEQDNDLSNGKEPIEWIVLDKRDDGSLVLLSKYALDCKQYNRSFDYVTWETCTLRKWLNEDFYNAAFSTGEQAKIVPVTIENEDNLKYRTAGGRATQDKAWLLSINEVANEYSKDKVYSYFTDDTSRICYPTAYAKAQGAYTYNNGVCWWWLRSPGTESSAAFVRENGYVYGGGNVNYAHDSVRPVVVVLP